MTKQEIIGMINEVTPKIKTDIFREESDKNNIGSNQFRELANICRHSECYEEIEMLIRYNEAKCIETKKNGVIRTSWAILMNDEKTAFADLIVACMKKIKTASENDEICLKDLSLFFGYFYWNARIWAAENKAAAVSNNAAPNNRNNNYNGGSQRRKW